MQRVKGKASGESMDNSEASQFSFYAPAFAAASTALILWSGTAIANKIAVAYMDALSAGVLRSLLAGIVATIIAVVLRLPFPNSRRDTVILLVSGISSFAIWPALLSLGIERTTAIHAALIMALIPIITVLFATFIDGGKLRMGWWAGSAIAITATAVLVVARADTPQHVAGGTSVYGDLLILLGCVTCSIGYVAGGKLSAKLGTAATTFWGLAAALLILIPVFFALYPHTVWTTIPLESWLALAWMSLLSSFTGYVLWFYALSHGGIRRIGSLQLAMPLITLALAMLLLNETLTTTVLGSCAAILAGTYLAHRYAG